MQGLRRCAVVAGLLLGCDSDDTDAPVDVPVGASGLVVAWSSQPESWPADLGDSVVLERATFALDSLRAVGDAGPGDPRTTVTGLIVQWDDTIAPADITFADAPVGLYSQLSLVLDGGVTSNAFELRGRVTVDSSEYEFRIEDTDALALTLPIDKMLSPPAVATLRLRVNFANALDSLDFSSLDNEGGRLELDTGDPQMEAFRAKLLESITVTDAAAAGVD